MFGTPQEDRMQEGLRHFRPFTSQPPISCSVTALATMPSTPVGGSAVMPNQRDGTLKEARDGRKDAAAAAAQGTAGKVLGLGGPLVSVVCMACVTRGSEMPAIGSANHLSLNRSGPRRGNGARLRRGNPDGESPDTLAEQCKPQVDKQRWGDR